jgi:mRNA interferase HigB
MRVIKPSRIRDFQRAYPQAASGLGRWLELVEAHDWSSLVELRQVFPPADAVTVASGRTATVFNIGGNQFRLETAIHYNRRIVYVLTFMTHAQYGRQTWKETL